MKVQLNEERTIHGRLYATGETVIMRKDEGQRLINEGIANRVITVSETRMIRSTDNRDRRFSNHTQLGR